MMTYRGSFMGLPLAYTGITCSDEMDALHTGQLAPCSNETFDSSHYNDDDHVT